MLVMIMRMTALSFFMFFPLGSAYAQACYEPYQYSSEAFVSSGKIMAGGESHIEGILHVRNQVDDKGVRESLFFLETERADISLSAEVNSLGKSISHPIKVLYGKNGFPQKIRSFDGNQNEILNGISREFFYPTKNGTYQFTLDDIESRYQIAINDQLMSAQSLDTESPTQKTVFTKSDYTTRLIDDKCRFFDQAESSREVIQTSSLLSNELLIKSNFKVTAQPDSSLSNKHWFRRLRFDDSLWESPDFTIKTDLQAPEAKQRIANLVERFRKGLDDQNLLDALITDQDTWLIYLPEFLAESSLDDEVSKKLFLTLGKSNSRLAVEVLNLVAQKVSIHEDHRFRSVVALLTTDAPMSTTLIGNMNQVINDKQFAVADVSSKAYIMSLGAIAANREETAPGQTSSLRSDLVGNLAFSQDPLVAVINSVGNLRKSANNEALVALESIATNPNAMSDHQKASSISSLARLENSNLSVDQIRFQMNADESPAVKKEWVGLAAKSQSVNKTSAKQLLLSVAENQKTEGLVRDYAVQEVTTQLSTELDATDIQRLRQLIPTLQSKEAKASIYKLLVNAK